MILIAIPLGVYLLVLMFSTRDFSPDGKSETRAAEPLHDEPDPVAPETAEASMTALPPGVVETVVIAQDGITPESPTAIAQESNQPDADASIAPAALVTQAEHPAPDDPIRPIESTTIAHSIPEATEKSSATSAATNLVQAGDEDESQPILSGQPLILPGKDAPKYAFDYRGRLWVEKKRRGFFRQLRRPQLPPDDPTNNSGR